MRKFVAGRHVDLDAKPGAEAATDFGASVEWKKRRHPSPF
jgi:hypothetical protein